jgi:hypothetical protein
MKTNNHLLLLSAFLTLTLATSAQNLSGIDSTGLPGDNFSLQGALSMFKKASSPEDFEKLINTEDNGVNNLDLNEDGQIDYVRVIDKADKDVHAFVLQVAVSENENQDIAVIELEKTGNDQAVVQIVGDEDLYGEEVIVEPAEDGNAYVQPMEETITGGPYIDESRLNAPGIVVNVWFWPSVRFIYGPVYRPYVSPWRWRHYPGWWRPWRPLGWHAFYPRFHRYHPACVVVHTNRVVRAHNLYRPARVTSVTVRTRHSTALHSYRVTHTRTTVTGPRGHSVTRSSTTVRGKHGKVKARKTRVTRHH